MEKFEPVLTRERILAPGALASLGDVLERHHFGRRLFLVTDDIIWAAVGHAFTDQLPPNVTLTRHSLGRTVRPLATQAQDIATIAAGADALIALGSGTVNDITKYTAMLLGKPYLCIATAASMNGYTSANASLEEHHTKLSFRAQPPRALIADMHIIASAPKRLSRAGLGDTLCRSTVETDMLMSHLLLGTDYPRAIFDRLRSHEPELITNAPRLRENDPAFYALLMAALIDAGDAMATYGSSAVASQGEHMIGHTAEMLYGSELHDMLHGEIIAVATLTMSQLQQKMLLAAPTLKHLPRPDGQFHQVFGKQASDTIAALYAKKILTEEQCTDINARVAQQWPIFKEMFAAVATPHNVIERAFIQSSVPTHPSELRIIDERYQSMCQYAYLTRDRFTFLDLAAMNTKRISTF